jgi:hypothetical protein
MPSGSPREIVLRLENEIMIRSRGIVIEEKNNGF